jgi:hypothetical protein
VYLWADGIYCNVRLTDDRPCLLVIVGARADGTKELVRQRSITLTPRVASRNLVTGCLTEDVTEGANDGFLLSERRSIRIGVKRGVGGGGA